MWGRGFESQYALVFKKYAGAGVPKEILGGGGKKVIIYMLRGDKYMG